MLELPKKEDMQAFIEKQVVEIEGGPRRDKYIFTKDKHNIVSE